MTRVFALLLLSTIGFTGFTPNNKITPSSVDNKFSMNYRGYFITDVDVVISVYTNGLLNPAAVTNSSFGINVGGPFYSASGTVNASTVSNFHSVMNGVTYNYSGPLQH